MNKSSLFFISFLSLAIGMLVYAIQYEWIVIRFSQQVISDHPVVHTKKNIHLYYWDSNRWHKESQEILWTKEITYNLETVITAWLALMDSERITPKKVSLQAATVALSGKDAFISFDRTPFSKSSSIQKKWMLIESLLKTVRENALPISSIQFLIEHQPMSDPHLDFSYAWPINGFMLPHCNNNQSS